MSIKTSKTTIRICTWNVWNALSPYGYGWLGPVIMPLLESREESQARQKRQVEALLRLRKSDFDVFCMQEVNPVHQRRLLLASALGMKDAAVRCNAGVKFGEFGLPFHLSEGLLTLTGKAFKKRKTTRLTLSGNAYEWKTPMGATIFAQLGERRCALMVESTVKDRRIAVVNLHLHHGTDHLHGNVLRRRNELSRLAWFLKRRAQEVDLLAVCGDFNCEADSAVLEPILELGLEDCAGLAGKKSKPTWLPRRNALTRVSAEVARLANEDRHGWEAQPHVFDRIYLRARKPLQKVDLKRVLDGPMLSDHYGALAEITF